MVKKKRSSNLPQCIIPIPNPDKTFHEKWTLGRDMLNIPHPFRCCIIGPPNSGKSTISKNIWARCKNPQFADVYIIHCDESTMEYNDLGEIHILTEIPPPSFWAERRDIKKLVICDDIDFKNMNKEQRHCMDRLLGYCSTHCNVSVIMCMQDPYALIPSARRMTSFWIIYKNNDMDAMKILARKIGIKSEDLVKIFDNFFKSKHDALYLDYTDKTPYPMRLNGYQLIRKK